MGTISNIIDAFRRIGSATQKAALRRQDAALEGKEVLERSQQNITDSLGHSHVFIATTAPVPEKVTLLTDEEIRPIRENIEFGIRFFRAFGIESGTSWGLDELDEAFARWQDSRDKLGYSNEFVIEVLGAMFGEYCSAHLNMRWITLQDQDGSTLAIDGVEREFRVFPYQIISKRIHDSEQGFFRPIFIAIKNHSTDASSRAADA